MCVPRMPRWGPELRALGARVRDTLLGQYICVGGRVSLRRVHFSSSEPLGLGPLRGGEEDEDEDGEGGGEGGEGRGTEARWVRVCTCVRVYVCTCVRVYVVVLLLV